MDESVQLSINSRKQAIFSGYDIKDEYLKNEINALFEKIEQFGKDCVDSIDFEAKFASSELNTEYINLFTKIATTCNPIIHESDKNANIDEKTLGDEILEETKSELKYQLDNLTQPLRREVYQETYNTVRDMPVVGDILTVKQHVDFFSRFKKKKDDNDNENSKNKKL